MERINLIPDDLVLTWREQCFTVVDRRFVSVLAWTLAMVCVLQGGAALYQGILIRRYTKQVSGFEVKRSTLTAELENARAYLAQLDQVEQQLQQQIQRLGRQITYLGVYRGTPGAWATILREVKRTIPYGVWLTELEGGQDGQLRIAGGAFEDRLVTQFMGQLKDNPRFTNVAFTFTKKAQIGKTDIIAFELTCQVVSTEGAPS